MGLWAKGINRSMTGKFRMEDSGDHPVIPSGYHSMLGDTDWKFPDYFVEVYAAEVFVYYHKHGEGFDKVCRYVINPMNPKRKYDVFDVKSTHVLDHLDRSKDPFGTIGFQYVVMETLNKLIKLYSEPNEYKAYQT